MCVSLGQPGFPGVSNVRPRPPPGNVHAGRAGQARPVGKQTTHWKSILTHTLPGRALLSPAHTPSYTCAYHAYVNVSCVRVCPCVYMPPRHPTIKHTDTDTTLGRCAESRAVVFTFRCRTGHPENHASAHDANDRNKSEDPPISSQKSCEILPKTNRSCVACSPFRATNAEILRGSAVVAQRLQYYNIIIL